MQKVTWFHWLDLLSIWSSPMKRDLEHLKLLLCWALNLLCCCLQMARVTPDKGFQMFTKEELEEIIKGLNWSPDSLSFLSLLCFICVISNTCKTVCNCSFPLFLILLLVGLMHCLFSPSVLSYHTVTLENIQSSVLILSPKARLTSSYIEPQLMLMPQRKTRITVNSIC